MDLSPEPKKKIKKAKLSKSVASQKLSKEAILNRMSSGKKRPKSASKINKGQKTPTKEDLVAKKLDFEDGSDGDDNLPQSPVKPTTELGGGSISKKSSSVKKMPSSTTKWEITEGKPSAKKQKKSQKKQDTDAENMDKESNEPNEVDNFEVDAEIDFPVLKRKSLGLAELKEAQSAVKSGKMVANIPKKTTENGQGKKKAKGKAVSEDSRKNRMNKIEGEEKGKRQKEKKRGKKRHRSNSETEEPMAKKGKRSRKKPSGDEALAVRCGNLPAGVDRYFLRMFIGEADIFPTRIEMKRPRNFGRKTKKLIHRYVTIFCSSAEEVNKLCNLNGITMPSPHGGRDRKLLIHKLNADEDPIIKRKLFISNLHRKVKEEDLMDFFENANCHPTNIVIPKQRSDNMSKGYAFVWMKSASDGDRALNLKEPTIRDQVISISRSKNRHPNRQEP